MGTGPFFVRKRTFSTCGQNIRKWGLSPFFLDVKNLKGARLFPKTVPNNEIGNVSLRECLLDNNNSSL